MTVGLSKSLSCVAHGIIWHWALVSCLGCLDSMAWNQHHPFLLVYNSRHLPSSQKSWWTQKRVRRPFNMRGYNDTMRRGERKENNWYTFSAHTHRNIVYPWDLELSDTTLLVLEFSPGTEVTQRNPDTFYDQKTLNNVFVKKTLKKKFSFSIHACMYVHCSRMAIYCLKRLIKIW